MIEEWREIEGFPNYEVSNCGRFRNKKFDRFLRVETTKNGYNRVVIYGNTKRFRFLVHRLVGQAFIPNPENKPQINHIDGIKHNNNVSNLEWLSVSDNAIHAYKNGLRQTNYGGSKLTVQQVIDIRVKYETGKYTQRQLCKDYGVKWITIHDVVHRHTWKHVA